MYSVYVSVIGLYLCKTPCWCYEFHGCGPKMATSIETSTFCKVVYTFVCLHLHMYIVRWICNKGSQPMWVCAVFSLARERNADEAWPNKLIKP